MGKTRRFTISSLPMLLSHLKNIFKSMDILQKLGIIRLGGSSSYYFRRRHDSIEGCKQNRLASLDSTGVMWASCRSCHYLVGIWFVYAA